MVKRYQQAISFPGCVSVGCLGSACEMCWLWKRVYWQKKLVSTQILLWFRCSHEVSVVEWGWCCVLLHDVESCTLPFQCAVLNPCSGTDKRQMCLATHADHKTRLLSIIVFSVFQCVYFISKLLKHFILLVV